LDFSFKHESHDFGYFLPRSTEVDQYRVELQWKCEELVRKLFVVLLNCPFGFEVMKGFYCGDSELRNDLVAARNEYETRRWRIRSVNEEDHRDLLRRRRHVQRPADGRFFTRSTPCRR
jgi:hypothetical protein